MRKIFLPASLLLLSVLITCNSKKNPDLRTTQWIHGSQNCQENKDAPIQAVQYNSNTWLLRQNKCIHFEAPFMFLLAGNDKALLIDTGATEDSISFPIHSKITELLDAEQKRTGKSLNLIVAHTHSHGDHFAGDKQFQNKPHSRVVGLHLQEVQEFLGFETWPTKTSRLDLGDRELTIIPIPGHDEMSIAIYDAETKMLLTGDSFYPGRLYIRDWQAFRSSIARLNDFCKTHSVDWILGNHIEMKDSLCVDYPEGATYQPHEQKWPLTLTDLNFLNEELSQLHEPIHKVYDKFILQPVAPVSEQQIEAKAIHTMTLAGYPDFLVADGENVWVTNLDKVQKLSLTSANPVMQVTVQGICGAPVMAHGSLWVTSCSQKSIARIDPKSGKILAMIQTGVSDADGELSLAAGDNAIWVLSDVKGKLTRIDANTNQIAATILVASDSHCAAFGFGSVWITNTKASTVQRIDPTSNKVIATIPVGGTPRFLTAGEGYVCTLNQLDGTVSMIDPATNRVIATIDAKVPGTGGDIDTGAGWIWVRAKNNRMLQAIHPRTGKVNRIYGPLNGSGAVRVAGKNVWVTAHDVHKVWVLK